MQNIAIIGSTGSIGVQALDIIRENSDRFKVRALTCKNNIELIYNQAKEFSPDFVVVSSSKLTKEIIQKFAKINVKIIDGDDALETVSALDIVDTIIYSTVGFSCLKAVLVGINNKKRICLANKETLVTGGEIVMNNAKKSGVPIYPIDSEHSAIFQCLMGNSLDSVSRLIITASGGAFRGYSNEQLRNVTAADALKHPNWSMGKKITIDCATLVNKAFEVIEAKWLFDLPLTKIDYCLHKESIIHSMVEYVDGSIIAQIGNPSMTVPILFSLTYPDRITSFAKRLNFLEEFSLDFKPLIRKDFPCFDLVLTSIEKGGLYPTIANAANEVLVEKFLNNEIGFLDIPKFFEKALEQNDGGSYTTVDEVIEKDKSVRQFMYSLLGK